MVALPTLKEDERVIDSDGPRVRLLICHDCHTVDVLPWYDGPPEYDDTLTYRLADHQGPMERINGRYEPAWYHRGVIATVNEKSWEDPGKQIQIIDELSKAHAGGEVGLGSAVYHARSNFKEDAMACWRAHNRTTNCGDYKSDAKRLVPDTRGDRKELGLETKSRSRPGTYLCVFCPYHSVVMSRARKEQGFY
jgi:hypothetical protein